MSEKKHGLFLDRLAQLAVDWLRSRSKKTKGIIFGVFLGVFLFVAFGDVLVPLLVFLVPIGGVASFFYVKGRSSISAIKVIDAGSKEIRNIIDQAKIEGVSIDRDDRSTRLTRYVLRQSPYTIGFNKQVEGLADAFRTVLRNGNVEVESDHKAGGMAIVVPKKQVETVLFSDLASTSRSVMEKCALPIMFGKDTKGRVLVHDLATMPHLLVAGATGSGKSVFLRGVIEANMGRCVMYIVDPKFGMDYGSYRGRENVNLITDMALAVDVLNELVEEMDERYKQYTQGKKFPKIVFICDEVADLVMMMEDKAVFEKLVLRLAQKARAVGIHVVLATQRPTVDIITGNIKANVPCRVSFYLPSATDSKTILDESGAEKLLKHGDGLLKMGGETIRFQAGYVE